MKNLTAQIGTVLVGTVLAYLRTFRTVQLWYTHMWDMSVGVVFCLPPAW